ncbi:collagen alpha-1(XVII) chain-like [Symphalangus syndactylus]|uniref:collagen alpha-1(XVII) chain-like n=1 Tax=Symphalangus syndactylus TaxID=9590 RepID=UPI00244168F7|nr:collagen alpha-1(XVII) chain-like [Symphalangus syndactylus]
MRKRSGPGQPPARRPAAGSRAPRGPILLPPAPAAQPAGGAAPSPARQPRDSPPGARGSTRCDPPRQSRPPLLALSLPGLQLCLSLSSPPAPPFPAVPGMVPGTPRTPRLREVRGLAGEGVGGRSAARGAGRIFSAFYGSFLHSGTLFFCLFWELSGSDHHRPVAPAWVAEEAKMTQRNCPFRDKAGTPTSLALPYKEMRKKPVPAFHLRAATLVCPFFLEFNQE